MSDKVGIPRYVLVVSLSGHRRLREKLESESMHETRS